MNNLETSHAPLLATRDLCKIYQEGKIETPVLQQVNFSLNAGALMAIVGSSGSGKSTLLHLLGGLDKPTSGEVLFQGEAISQLSEIQRAAWRNQQIGFIYQFHHLLPDFSAMENVAMPLLIAGVKPKIATERAQAMLEQVQLAHRANHRPSEMSGGERQRVAIARALINQPALVMADEPTGNLDQRTAEAIFDLLLDLNRQHNTTFLVVTHDLLLAKKLDQQLLMQNGQLTEVNG